VAKRFEENMATSPAIRKRTLEFGGSAATLVDLETRATEGDHQALRLWLRFLSCTMHIETRVRSGLRKDFSTTLPRFDLMAQLERHPDGLRMTELSKRLMVSGGNVTGITDQLEGEGMVERSLDRSDRRAITVKLTASGLKCFRVMAAQHEQWIVELLSGLSPQNKQDMMGILGRLKKHLSLPAQAGTSPWSNPANRRR
jgi:DNA-binding MarR family transcriptional regulator